MRRIRGIHSSRLRSNAIPCEIVNTFLERIHDLTSRPRAMQAAWAPRGPVEKEMQKVFPGSARQAKRYRSSRKPTP